MCILGVGWVGGGVLFVLFDLREHSKLECVLFLLLYNIFLVFKVKNVGKKQ